MSKYYIDCREVGWQDCGFSTEADTIEQVVEQLADHIRIHYNLKGFGHELYSKMRQHIRRREDGSRVHPSDGDLAQVGDRDD
jgi:predicted small metal-binding protein